MKLEPANIVCPACGSGNYMRHLIGKNVGYLNMKCINCNSYFNFDELYKRRIGEVSKPKPITNADRIRAMTDEELAEWLDGGFRHADWCDISNFPNSDCMEFPCLGCIIDWLKQEVEDDGKC